ncbi:MAG: hypothetical protein HQL69_00200 [Magnetococcales bacterium]|nr:hypothetical protein [Magnetococcales bacterium]
MKSYILKFSMMLVSVLCIGLGSEAFAKSPPVAMLIQVKGKIEYSKNGTKWKKVRRNKFLFEGYIVKTGADGSAQLINQITNMSRTVGPNTEFKIAKHGGELISGHLSKPTQAAGGLSASLNKRFAKAQRYTTVRRSVDKKKKMKLSAIKEITLSAEHPDLVWQGMGSDISYRVYIDGTPHNIAPVTSKIVRFRVPPLSGGQHKYSVDLIKDGKVVYKSKKSFKINWLSGAELAKFQNGLDAVRTSAPGDDFMVANYLEEQGLTVAAMDMYKQYFTANADDIDMYPMLIKAYHDLKLKDLKKAEAVKYNLMLDSDS